MIDLLSELPAEVSGAASDAARLFWETPFTEYTVTEGFLLLYLLVGFIGLIIYFFKGGF